MGDDNAEGGGDAGCGDKGLLLWFLLDELLPSSVLSAVNPWTAGSFHVVDRLILPPAGNNHCDSPSSS